LNGLENSICGPGSHCNTQDNKCESGYGTAFPGSGSGGGGGFFDILKQIFSLLPGLGSLLGGLGG